MRPRWQHTDAQRRLDTTGWRGRRAARHELADAEVRRRARRRTPPTHQAPHPPGHRSVQPGAGTRRRGTHRSRSPRQPGSAPPHSRPGLGPATTGRSPRAVESMGQRRHHQLAATRRHHRRSSPATVAETTTPTSSDNSEKRHKIGPTTLASTCRPEGDTHEPSDEPAPDLSCRRGQTATRSGRSRSESKRSPVPGSPRSRRTVENRAHRSPQTHEVGAGGTRNAEHSARIRSPTRACDDAGGGNADRLSSDVRYHQPAKPQPAVQRHDIARRHTLKNAGRTR